MKFSVIVPVYNAEEYLSECINSVLSQSFTRYEVILVDDGSNDCSPIICEEYAKKDSRICVIHKENGGAADARNVGMKAAKGEILLFLDSDDFWNTSDVMSRLEQEFAQSNADVVQFGMQKLLSGKKAPEQPEQRIRFFEDCNGERPYLQDVVKYGKLSISAASMAIKRDFIEANQLYFVKGITCEDIEWGVRLFSYRPKAVFLPDTFYVIRYKRQGSVTMTINNSNLNDYCYVLERLVGHLDSVNEINMESLYGYVMYQIMIAAALINKVKLLPHEKKGFHKRLKNLARGRLTKYTSDPRVKKVIPIYNCMGYHITSWILCVYLRFRKR